MRRFLLALAALLAPAAALADSTVPALPTASSLTTGLIYVANGGANDNSLGLNTTTFCIATSKLTICAGGIADAMLASTFIKSGAAAGGDLTGTFPNPTLAATAITPNTYGDATHVAQCTFDQKGRATGCSNVVITQPAGANPSQTVDGSVHNGSATTFMRSDGAPALASTAVTPGSYTNVNATVDQQGRITAMANGSAGSVGTVTVANAGSTGTTVNKLAKLTGAPSTAVITATTDAPNATAVGVVTAGAGTTGSATIQFNGSASCVFDNATTAGHSVGLSTSVAGDCTDLGATPTSQQIVGTVLATNAGAGTNSVLFNVPFTGGIASPGASQVLTSNSSSVPVWGTALPSGLTATNMTLTTPALGTPSALVLTNATALPAAQVSSGALVSGMTATTQAVNDNSTKIATTAYVDRPVVFATGTTHTFVAPAEIWECTGTCTVTPPTPAAGYQFCVRNADNVATVITLAAVASVLYEKTTFASYGTANTAATSAGAAGDKVCLVGKDSTHYDVFAFNGTWSMP